MIVLTAVVLRQSVCVAKDITTFALNTQKANLLATVKASLAVLLYRLFLDFWLLLVGLNSLSIINRHLGFR